MGAIRATAAVVIAALALLALPGAAAAQSPYPPGPFAPWDGSVPFNCAIQDVGTGVGFPDPDADPFCVEFDKTQQNITDLGILDFLLNEPARVAAAVPKCFYYQSDHWTGSIVQGETPELWHWDGQYFFDKARAVGGVNLQNFRVLGMPASLGSYVPLPPEYAPYFDQAGGGTYLIADIPADPTCVAKVDTPEEAAQVYAGGAPPPLPPSSGSPPGPALSTAGAAAAARKRCKRKKSKRARARCRRKARPRR